MQISGYYLPGERDPWVQTRIETEKGDATSDCHESSSCQFVTFRTTVYGIRHKMQLRTARQTMVDCKEKMTASQGLYKQKLALVQFAMFPHNTFFQQASALIPWFHLLSSSL